MNRNLQWEMSVGFRLRSAVRFQLECLLLRGTGPRLLVIAGVIALVTVIDGMLAHLGTGEFAIRQNRLERYGTPRNGWVRNFRGDSIAHGELARFNPSGYDSVVLFASDRMASREEANARTFLGVHLLQQWRGDSAPRHVLMEILDPENVALLDRSRCEVLTSPVMLSHMVAHVALRPELNPIFYQLLVSGGVEIAFHSAEEYGLEEGAWDFPCLQAAAQKRGDIALGVRQGMDARILLNPDRQRRLDLAAEDEIAILTSNGESVSR